MDETHAVEAYAVAAAVADPELPFLTVEDLGILRTVTIEHGITIARVSPTYSGCPAVAVIEQAIFSALTSAGYQAKVERVLSPPWTTDWITERGRRKLVENGIAAPTVTEQTKPFLFAQVEVSCPRCASVNTEKVSEFGSTPCKAQYRCTACAEPFDYFKCH